MRSAFDDAARRLPSRKANGYEVRTGGIDYKRQDKKTSVSFAINVFQAVLSAA
jgi:hypothetical protein